MAEVIAFLSFVLSVIALIFSTKRYELKREYYNSILSWYSNTNLILIKLQKADAEVKIELLCDLSTQIDTGRFYFPNIETDFGKEKPPAYRGLRTLILDLLVLYYDIFDKGLENDKSEEISRIQKYFTSEIFEYLKPLKLKKDIKKYTKIASEDRNVHTAYLYVDPEINKLILLNNHKHLK